MATSNREKRTMPGRAASGIAAWFTGRSTVGCAGRPGGAGFSAAMRFAASAGVTPARRRPRIIVCAVGDDC